MFHLLVSFSGWSESSGTLGIDRVFEYTDSNLVEDYKPNNTLDISKISTLPALFMSETDGSGEQFAKVGFINYISIQGREIHIGYTIDNSIPPIPNRVIEKLALKLSIEEFEFSRTHWSIKNIDLFRILYSSGFQNYISPKVFSVEAIYETDETLVSVMMPFNSSFDIVFNTLNSIISSLEMNCTRADNIWEHDAIIQDVVSLISRSKIVICDCTGKNPNVFYEAGIAHTLGKDVILITQNEDDIPFDLRHLRYIKYLNNSEGLDKLKEELSKRIKTLLS